MKINLKEIIKSNIKSDFLPVFPILKNGKLFFGVNTNGLNNCIYGNDIFIICYDLNKDKVDWIREFNDKDTIGIETGFIIYNDKIIICTTRELLVLNINTGITLWKKSFKNFSGEITVLHNRLFFSNWGELMELDFEKGKKIQSKKPRVSWFDSKIINYKDRYFISTSNSKILELSIDNLDIKNQYKFTGGWAIGTEPVFFEDKLISGSYGSKIVIFDLIENKEIKRFKKVTGSKPQQIKSNDSFFFAEIENDNNTSILSCYNLIKGKKVWKKSFEEIIKLGLIQNEIFIITLKDDSISAYLIDKKTGAVNKTIESNSNSTLQKFNHFYGINLVHNENILVSSIEPNTIKIKTLHNKGYK